jgi:hypothetical protein
MLRLLGKTKGTFRKFWVHRFSTSKNTISVITHQFIRALLEKRDKELKPGNGGQKSNQFD